MIKRVVSVFIVMFLFINLVLINSVQAYTNIKKNEDDFIVCIDPGHQGKGDSRGEPVAPNSSNTKPRVSSGTAGVATKNPEHVINLEASLILKELLLQKGYTVVMTREKADVNISNAERAQIANNAKADITIRIHCDSINDGGKTGTVILVPAKMENIQMEFLKIVIGMHKF